MEELGTAAQLLREDVALMKAGKLKCLSHGFDATPEQIQRLETVLEKLRVSYAELGNPDA